MKLTDTQEELYRKDLKDIQRGYNLTGEKRVLRIALKAAVIIFMAFMFCWLIFRQGAGKDFAPYLFAALKINYPSISSLSPAAAWVHILSYLILGIAATALTPLITVILNNWIDRQVAEIENGLKVYKHIYHHYVLIGYNRMAPQILLQLLEEDKEVYAILMTTQNVIQYRKDNLDIIIRIILNKVITSLDCFTPRFIHRISEYSCGYQWKSYGMQTILFCKQ